MTVIDASAVLAFLKGEAGAGALGARLGEEVLTTDTAWRGLPNAVLVR